MKALLIFLMVVAFGWFSLVPTFSGHTAKSQTAVQQQQTSKVILARGQCSGCYKGNNAS